MLAPTLRLLNELLPVPAAEGPSSFASLVNGSFFISTIEDVLESPNSFLLERVAHNTADWIGSDSSLSSGCAEIIVLLPMTVPWEYCWNKANPSLSPGIFVEKAATEPSARVGTIGTLGWQDCEFAVARASQSCSNNQGELRHNFIAHSCCEGVPVELSKVGRQQKVLV
jgi:hypothetical protein